MARLVIVIHEYDRFTHIKPGVGLTSNYLLHDVLRELQGLGHSWSVWDGNGPVTGDAALLHVDSTIVEDRYLSLKSQFARTINFGTGNISKRKVSRLLLSGADDWTGKVIVKADLNNDGGMEILHNRAAQHEGRSIPHPGVKLTGPYRVLNSLRDVPDALWRDPAMIVERFVPEVDDHGFALRTWVFMGPRERCNRIVTAAPISKAADVLRLDPVDIPDELRAERERLNFDFGKFDFVIHDGQPLLLDANRTPGVAPAIEGMLKAGARNLAEGLDALLAAPA